MAKPLGLGSVKITPTLKLIDRSSEKGRYSILFENERWNESSNIIKDKDYYKKEFEKHVLDQLKENKTSLWEIPRMKELKAMLDWNKTTTSNWNNKTDYLALSEFKNRKVLPYPTDL
jgi:hypothetical protein